MDSCHLCCGISVQRILSSTRDDVSYHCLPRSPWYRMGSSICQDDAPGAKGHDNHLPWQHRPPNSPYPNKPHLKSPLEKMVSRSPCSSHNPLNWKTPTPSLYHCLTPLRWKHAPLHPL